MVLEPVTAPWWLDVCQRQMYPPVVVDGTLAIDPPTHQVPTVIGHEPTLPPSVRPGAGPPTDRPKGFLSACGSYRRVDKDLADPDDLAALRAAFQVDDGGESALGWAAVRDFEAEHGIVLPEPYRTFVAQISDGSDSGPPEFGLVGLAELPDDWGDDRPERLLRRPFPLTSMWLWEVDPRPSEEVEPLLEPVFNDGSIVLGTDGCGMYWHLIVSGPHRGHIWNISGEGATPFDAGFGHTTADPGFMGWVRHWTANKPWFDAT
ncbi:SMI1/KNR4 family protein [Micromonospora sp. NPDC004704]